MPESREHLSERPLSSVAERRVAKIVPHTDRFDKILIQTQGTANRPRDLGDLEGMSQSSAVVIAARANKYLSLVDQSAEALGVNDAIAIALELRAHCARFLCTLPLRAGTSHRTPGEDVVLYLFQLFTDCAHVLP